MKPIATPAYRPTADCIWNSFRSSNKRHLILTGSRGCGKSTLLSRLLPGNPPGITTRALPMRAVILEENATGETAPVGVFDPSLPGPENRMTPLRDGFVSLGVPALTRCMNGPGEWIAIDEIGYLEAQCPEYHAALFALMERKRVAAVVRKQALPFLDALRNRDDSFVMDLDDPFGPLGCVIMASGMGRRFGGNKLMADFRGQPMIRRVLDATEGIFAERVVVTRHSEIARLCEALGIRTILHDLPHRNDTVRLGMEQMESVERCMFCPGDQPLLRRETVASLALASAGEPAALWRTAFGDAPGSPVVFPDWTFPELLSLPEGKGGSVVIKKHPERVRYLPVSDPTELMDADTPEALEQLQAR